MNIDELCGLFGIKPGTIHYYREIGLLPPPHGGRRWASYGQEHVKRLRAILDAKDTNATLAELAERFTYQAQAAT